ncbi:MAG: DinB family protein [Mobilitalea sp.]
MFQVGVDWNPLQAKLKEIILKKDHFDEMKQLLLKMHSLVHSSEVYNNQIETYMDEIWKDLSDKAFRTMPTIKDDTVAWNIWHSTRIEDLTSNLLIKNQSQVLDDGWLHKLNITIKDTGNAMSDDEILALSNQIDRDSLYEYRNAVGLRTKEIIEGLRAEDMKRKVTAEGLKQIANEGGVTQHPDSVWLLEFWGKKNVAGILLMPITRHQIVHLNDCKRLKILNQKG